MSEREPLSPLAGVEARHATTGRVLKNCRLPEDQVCATISSMATMPRPLADLCAKEAIVDPVRACWSIGMHHESISGGSHLNRWVLAVMDRAIESRGLFIIDPGIIDDDEDRLLPAENLDRLPQDEGHVLVTASGRVVGALALWRLEGAMPREPRILSESLIVDLCLSNKEGLAMAVRDAVNAELKNHGLLKEDTQVDAAEWKPTPDRTNYAALNAIIAVLGCLFAVGLSRGAVYVATGFSILGAAMVALEIARRGAQPIHLVWACAYLLIASSMFW